MTLERRTGAARAERARDLTDLVVDSAKVGETNSDCVAAPGLLGVFARGLAMGVAEIVPGVSGGTIAFITGIYDQLVRSLASFATVSLRTLVSRDWRAVARRHNLAFLATLAGGMVVSFLAVAKVIGRLIETHGTAVYGFFIGLIAGGVVHVGVIAARDGGARSRFPQCVFWVSGLLTGLLLALLNDDPAPHLDIGMAALFGAGVLASAAWILPGVSGAFVLLLLGLYEPLVVAVNKADLPPLLLFAAGLGLGAVAFSKVLAWVLARWRAPLLALLSGFMAGSLLLLWRRTGVAGWGDAGIVWVLCAALGGAGTLAGLVWLTHWRADTTVGTLPERGAP